MNGEPEEVTGSAELEDLPTQDRTREVPERETPAAPEPPAPDDLKKAMTELATTVQKGLAAREPIAQPREYTPEEVAKLWGVYDPEAADKEFFKKFGRFGEDATPEQIAEYKMMFAGMQKGMMQQAITGANNLIAIAMDRMQQEYAPIREYVDEMRRDQTRTRFFSQYDSLDDPKFEGIIGAVANTLANKQFENEDAYFKALAEGAAENIKQLIPEFALGEKKAKATTTGKTPKLPRTIAGGGGGAGKGRMTELAPTGSRNDIESLEFDEGQS